MVKRMLVAGCMALCLALAGLSWADDAPPKGKPDTVQKGKDIGAPKKEAPKDWVAERANSLKEKLGLSDEQVAKVKEILTSERDQMKAVKTDTTLSEEQKKAKLREIEKATNDAIVALLTPEQKAKWEEMRKSEQKGKGPKPKATGDNATGTK